MISIAMNRKDFEVAVSDALAASPHSGTKWRSLERYFADLGIRGGGALNNDPAERRTRVRQLLTKRRHPKFESEDYSLHAVYVVAQEAAEKLEAGPAYLQSILHDIRSERPNLPADRCLSSVLIVVALDDDTLKPIALMQWSDGPVQAAYRSWYPGIEVSREVAPGVTSSSAAEIIESTEVVDQAEAGIRGANVIYFDPPGTGKSYRAERETAEFAHRFRTVFHPEYSYAEFVGSYKPVSGADPSQRIRSYDGSSEIDRPVIYYEFEPGVLLRAIARACKHPGNPVALIIEEINRGDCAAIFGDFLQLLDRDESGKSQYAMRVSPIVGKWLSEQGVVDSSDAEIFLPGNLFIFATMNTSDQALYPMDAAFKRRWAWEAIPIDFGAETLEEAEISPAIGGRSVRWLDLLAKVNDAVVDAKLAGDKRIGPWYIKPVDNKIPAEQVRNKLLFYLWHDVFREQEHLCFSADVKTFDDVQRIFDSGGVARVLAPIFGTQHASAASVEGVRSEQGAVAGH